MFDSPDEFYEAIAGELNNIFTEDWIKVEVEVKRFDDSINLKIVYTKSDGSRESDVDEIMLPEYFFELAGVVSTPQKGLYKTCNFVLKNNGKYNVEFEY